MPILWIILASLLWSMVGPVSRFAFSLSASAMDVAFYRCLVGGGCFAVHALAHRKWHVQKKDWLHLVLFAVFGVVLLEGANLLAVKEGGAAFASIMLYSAPIWVAIFFSVFLKERMSKAKWIALTISLMGVAGVALSGNSLTTNFNGLALFWGLASGFGYAMFYIYGKLYFTKYDSSTIYAYAFLLAAAILYPLSSHQTRTLPAVGTFLFLGFVSTYLAYFFYAKGLQKIQATQASVLALTEPIFAAILAYCFWDERLGLLGMISACLILFGVGLMAIAK